MENSLEIVDEAELGYSRQRFKNRVFAQLVEFFASEAERRNITQADLAVALKKDGGQLNRLLRHPSNLTLETISDLLTALDAEMDTRVVRFADRAPANYMHPLMARIKQQQERPPVSMKIEPAQNLSHVEALIRSRATGASAAPTKNEFKTLEIANG